MGTTVETKRSALRERARIPLMERIANKTSPEPNSGCLIWLGYATKSGTPLIYPGPMLGPNRAVNGCRLVYEVAHGPIPVGLFVCHRCDVSVCLNVDHMFLGTNQDNMTDMARKGRGTKSSTGMPFGVTKIYSRFRTSLHFRGRTLYLGTYDTAEEASAVVQHEKARLLHAALAAEADKDKDKGEERG